MPGNLDPCEMCSFDSPWVCVQVLAQRAALRVRLPEGSGRAGSSLLLKAGIGQAKSNPKRREEPRDGDLAALGVPVPEAGDPAQKGSELRSRAGILLPLGNARCRQGQCTQRGGVPPSRGLEPTGTTGIPPAGAGGWELGGSPLRGEAKAPVPVVPGCSGTGQIRSHRLCPVPGFVLPCHLQPLPGGGGRASPLSPEAQNLGGPGLGTSGLSCDKGQIPPPPIPNSQELGFGVNPEQPCCSARGHQRRRGQAPQPGGGVGTGFGCRGAWSRWSPVLGQAMPWGFWDLLLGAALGPASC